MKLNSELVLKAALVLSGVSLAIALVTGATVLQIKVAIVTVAVMGALYVFTPRDEDLND